MQSEPTRVSKKRRKLVLDNAVLRTLAMNYAARYATNSMRMARYLRRKVNSAEWTDTQLPQIDDILARMAELNFVDDAAFAQAKGASLARRGFGARRIAQALRAEGADGELISDITSPIDPLVAAHIFARKKRLGPYAQKPLQPDDRRRQLATFARAGHDFSIACAILDSNVENLQDKLGER